MQHVWQVLARHVGRRRLSQPGYALYEAHAELLGRKHEFDWWAVKDFPGVWERVPLGPCLCGVGFVWGPLRSVYKGLRSHLGLALIKGVFF